MEGRLRKENEKNIYSSNYYKYQNGVRKIRHLMLRALAKAEKFWEEAISRVPDHKKTYFVFLWLPKVSYDTGNCAGFSILAQEHVVIGCHS